MHFSKNNYSKARIYLLLSILCIILVLALIPVIWASKFAYPWADDFSYGAPAHKAFLTYRSVLKAVKAAFDGTIETYTTWQGTYTSCFLMGLHPGVFGTKLYHLTGFFMLGSLFLSYIFLFYAILSRLLNFPKVVSFFSAILSYFITIECVDGKAEAFTWFNSAVHYTFGHTLLITFVGCICLYISTPAQNKSLIKCILISILGFLAAGVNNITVFGGLLFFILATTTFFIYEMLWGSKDYSKIIKISPMLIFYFIGSIINLASVGNKKRMLASSNEPNNFVLTVKNSFILGTAFIQRHFTLITLGFILILISVLWWAIKKENAFAKTTFKFPLPGLITLMSYCLLCALYAPFAYLDNAYDFIPAYIETNLGVNRVSNTVYYAFIILIALNTLYYLGWLYKRKEVSYSKFLTSLLVTFGIIIASISCKSQLAENPYTFLTSAAINALDSGSAEYYGYQMAVNFNILESDDDPAIVSPIAVNPDILYPHDASDWKEGARLYFEKKSVEYDREPYDF